MLQSFNTALNSHLVTDLQKNIKLFFRFLMYMRVYPEVSRLS